MSVEKNSIQEEASVQSEEINETEDITTETEEQIEIDVETVEILSKMNYRMSNNKSVELEAKLEEAENQDSSSTSRL